MQVNLSVTKVSYDLLFLSFYFMYFMDTFHCMHIKIFKVEHICTAFVAFFVNYIVEEASGDFGF